MVATLPFSDTQVSVPGYGLMGFSMSYGPQTPTAQAIPTLQRAVELGCTFWDTAAIYGAGHNERMIREFFEKTPGAREKVFLASKCGIAFNKETGEGFGVNNSAEHIKEYIDDSISRLGTKPDLYYLHRIEPGRDLEESVGTLDQMRKEGKCRYIGLSECGVETLRKACSIAKIDALQIEYSPWFTDHEQSGLISAARELGVTIIAYSPLGKGILTGSFNSADQFKEGDIRKTIPRFAPDVLDSNMKLVKAFQGLAEKKGCTSGQLALAWVIAQGAVPIPGTRNEERLQENCGASKVDLDEVELKEIRQLIESGKPEGARYNEAQMSFVGH